MVTNINQNTKRQRVPQWPTIDNTTGTRLRFVL